MNTYPSFLISCSWALSSCPCPWSVLVQCMMISQFVIHHCWKQTAEFPTLKVHVYNRLTLKINVSKKMYLHLSYNQYIESSTNKQRFDYDDVDVLPRISWRKMNLPLSIDFWAAKPTATDINPSSKPTAGGFLPCDRTATANSMCSKKLDPWCSPSYLHSQNTHVYQQSITPKCWQRP